MSSTSPESMGSSAPAAVEVRPVEELVAACESRPVGSHPFLSHMSRHPVDVQHMWLLFENIYHGLSKHFTRWLANAIAATEDDRIRVILAEQLYEELGSGDPERTHRLLLLKLLDSLKPWRPEHVTPAMLEPGRRWFERLDGIYADPDPYVRVGAAIAIELQGKQFDQFVADQFRRQQAVGMASLEWLTLHETLEIDHASESLQLAQWIEGDGPRTAAWRGGEAVVDAGWKFLDDIYEICVR